MCWNSLPFAFVFLHCALALVSQWRGKRKTRSRRIRGNVLLLLYYICSRHFLLKFPNCARFFTYPNNIIFSFFLVSALICCGLKISARTNLIFSIIFSNDFPCLFAGKRKRISLGCVSELFLMDLFSQAPAAFAFAFDYDDDYDNDIMNCNEFFLVSDCKWTSSSCILYVTLN